MSPPSNTSLKYDCLICGFTAESTDEIVEHLSHRKEVGWENCTGRPTVMVREVQK